MYAVRLIGDAQHPDDYVAVALPDLVAHSEWAAGRMRQAGNMYNQGINAVLPMCTPATVVKKIVEAIYSGYLELQDDVEQLLVLANYLQVRMVACTLNAAMPLQKELCMIECSI